MKKDYVGSDNKENIIIKNLHFIDFSIIYIIAFCVLER